MHVCIYTQISDKAVCISHSLNTFGESMNLISFQLCLSNKAEWAL